MQEVTWIIENMVNESSYQELVDAAKELNHPVIEINRDYSHDMLLPLKTYSDTRAIFQGSIQMTHIIFEQLRFQATPIKFCSLPNYNCSKYYTQFGKYLFNDNYAFISLAELQRQRFSFYGQYGKEAMIFIRPDRGYKPFQAQLLDIIDLDRFCKQHDDIKHELVVVSSPKNITWEGRFVVSERHGIIAHSTYRFQGQVAKIPSVPTGAKEYVTELLNVGYHPDKAYVIDLCQDSDQTFWLLELNSFSSAGLYATNKKDVVEKISELCME
jgi:hypothetical protein